MESNEEFHCTLSEAESKSEDIKESQGKLTSVEVIYELGKIEDKVEMADVKSAFQDIVVRKSEKKFPEVNNSEFEQDSSDRSTYGVYAVNGTTRMDNTGQWPDLNDEAEVKETEGGPFEGEPEEEIEEIYTEEAIKYKANLQGIS